MMGCYNYRLFLFRGVGYRDKEIVFVCNGCLILYRELGRGRWGSFFGGLF